LIKPIGDTVSRITIEKHPCAECGRDCYGVYCDKCSDRIAEIEDKKRREYEEAERQRIMQLRLNQPAATILQMGVPKAMSKFIFDNMKDKYPSFDKIGRVKEALDDGKGIFITGATGCGKTHLVIGGLYYIACQSALPLTEFGFIDVAEWAYLIDNMDKRERDAVIDEVAAKRYLAIDDAGWEGEYRKDIMRILFRKRFNLKNIDLLTTNFSITATQNDFAEFYRLDVFDRLKSRCKLITIAGKSLR
jgi:DNA replication protein DnaC